MRTDVMGICFDNVTLDEAVARAMELISAGGAHLVVTPNAEIVQMAGRDLEFAQVLNSASLVIPDGIGVVYASKILGRPLKGRVPGIEFAAALAGHMAESRLRLYLLGASPGVAELAAANLSATYPGLVICGVHDGYFQEDLPVVNAIRKARADVVFVCLGAPKQERWIAKNGAATGASLLVGLGGSLDVFAGKVQRAPEVWRKFGMEWLYRVIRQPERLGRVARLPLFLTGALGARIRGR